MDLLLLVEKRADAVAQGTRRLLYPLWDAGFRVGHAVLSPRAAIERARHDLHAATSCLSARLVAGDRALYDDLIDRRDRWIAGGRKRLLKDILRAVSDRHLHVDRAGWSLAPHLKDDIGGLRDVHAAGWLAAIAGELELDGDLATAGNVLLAAREALHAEAGRKLDRIHMELQAAVARRLGMDSDGAVDQLMAEIHGAARRIEHAYALAAEEIADSSLSGPRRSGSAERLTGGIVLEDGVLFLRHTPEDAVEAGMRLVAAHATTGKAIHRGTLRDLPRLFATPRVSTWTSGTREAFLELLAAPHAAAGLELLDRAGAWAALLPEWMAVRGLPQHDPYHRFTVDGHCFVAVHEARRAVTGGDRVAAQAATELPSLHAVYVAALLHDIGKGSGEDHTIAGEALARSACRRMGMDGGDVVDVATLVRQHLLLTDTATRRDLDDGDVIADVAAAIADARFLRMLYIVTVADGVATGPHAWTEWKAALVRELYRRTLVALEHGALPRRGDVSALAARVEAYEPSLAGRAGAILATLPPSYRDRTSLPEMADELAMLAHAPQAGEIEYRVDAGTELGVAVLTACLADRPGTLARTAGVLSLHRIPILACSAFATTAGAAIQRFIVRSAEARAPQDIAHELGPDLVAAHSGRLALEVALERKRRDYHDAAAPPPGPVDVRVLDDESPHSTVIEVRCPDRIGVLHAIAAAVADVGLDIHVAKVDTLRSRVVDVFYVRSPDGTKLDRQQGAAVAAAVRHRLGRLLSER